MLAKNSVDGAVPVAKVQGVNELEGQASTCTTEEGGNDLRVDR